MIAPYTPKGLLGRGIYTIAEAAMYARVSSEKMSRWIVGTSINQAAVISELEPDRNADKWVTFLDLVQSMAIRDIRMTHHVPLEKIRETIVMAKKKWGIGYPFARKHTTYLFGENINLDIEGYGLIESSGGHRNQLNMKQVMEQYLVDLSYDADGLAKGYSPLAHKGYKIVINPRVRFGEPMVIKVHGAKGKPCRHTVTTLCDAYESEGSFHAAARAYGVSQEAIEAAYKYFFDYLLVSNAA